MTAIGTQSLKCPSPASLYFPVLKSNIRHCVVPKWSVFASQNRFVQAPAIADTIGTRMWFNLKCFIKSETGMMFLQNVTGQMKGFLLPTVVISHLPNVFSLAERILSNWGPGSSCWWVGRKIALHAMGNCLSENSVEISSGCLSVKIECFVALFIATLRFTFSFIVWPQLHGCWRFCSFVTVLNLSLNSNLEKDFSGCSSFFSSFTSSGAHSLDRISVLALWYYSFYKGNRLTFLYRFLVTFSHWSCGYPFKHSAGLFLMNDLFRSKCFFASFK